MYATENVGDQECEVILFGGGSSNYYMEPG